MTNQGKKYLSDIESALELIVKFTASVNDFDQYNADLKTQSAVERQLGIIGEAINKFNKIEPAEFITSARQIVGLRNRLIHSYDNIDATIIWAILKKHLPLLKEEIAKKLLK